MAEEKKWTRQQQKVIDLRNRNILVSAAAGSGKTAVLVERIIKMVTDPDSFIDVDRLLVVTFTKAAAEEMRERIGQAIEKCIEHNPDDEHLQRQLTLIHNAQITTIDSFCLYVIRNYFQRIDLDPDFRIGDDGELKLLKNDVADEVIEQYYKEGSQNFLEFIESFSTGKSDALIKDMILQLHDFAMSYPKPKEWLKNCANVYNISTKEELKNSIYVKELMETAKSYLKDIQININIALSITREQDGPYMYSEAIEADKQFVDKAVKCSDYDELIKHFNNLQFLALSRKRGKDVLPEKKEAVKLIRDGVKNKLKKVKSKMFSSNLEKMLDIIKLCSPLAQVMIELTITFMENFSKKKLSKNILDFSDLEHYALDILIDENNVPTAAAMELQDNFFEILIDEYQDSNNVQDILLKSISKEVQGENNIFMVGDVKQSIYKFRLARPELFMEKYEQYTVDESECQRIDLHMNFRSRPEVLDSINFIFKQIMGKDIGNIEYNEDAELNAGRKFVENTNKEDNNTEFIMVGYDKERMSELEMSDDKKELEARAIGIRIKELVDSEGGMKVIDENEDGLRGAEYKDIVILLRSISGWGEKFVNILADMGIPAHLQTSTGYFSASEIKTLLSLLSVIDNPQQDIPLASVLTSAIGGFKAAQLAVMRCMNEEGSLFDILNKAAEQEFIEIDTSIATKTDRKNIHDMAATFIKMLNELRKASVYMPVHELIDYILQTTGYLSYISSMPGGDGRAANALMLVEKAVDYEKTSYKGLFNFVRYIKQLIDYEVDFGEAGIIDENDNTVRIMSIHKSKGLEFPIVFVSGMGKKFNRQDTYSRIILHPDMGVGMDYVDYKERIKIPTIIKQAVSRRINNESIGEELRVLYVALTRAKEKLIMTGVVENIEKKIMSNTDIIAQNKEQSLLPYEKILDATSYADWIIQALIRHNSFKDELASYGINAPFNNPLYDKTVAYTVKDKEGSDKILTRNIYFNVRELTIEDITNKKAADTIKSLLTFEEFRSIDLEDDYGFRTALKQRINYEYPHLEDINMKTKVSVSELKKRRMLEAEEIGDENILVSFPHNEGIDEDIIPYIPQFIRQSDTQTEEKEESYGAFRGTVYHKILELLDFDLITNSNDIKKELKNLKQKGYFTDEEMKLINVYDIDKFGKSSLSKRMAKASKENRLYKEQPFVIGKPAKEVFDNCSSEEIILIQGIIDVYFEEDDYIILADYKTDRVDTKEELVNRYKTQLNLYAEALEKITGKIVKQKIIYSFNLSKEVELI